MKFFLVPLLAVLWSPVSARDVAPSADEANASFEPRAIGEDATACKRKCNSRCSGAQNKSKCVAECRRACDR